MIKKIFGVIILVFALVSVLASCGHEHAWGEWETAKSATCTVEGIKERYCSCGEKQTGTIMSLGHMFGEWSTVVDATCAENGKERRSCSCGEFEEREIEKLKTHTEVVDSYVAPSCTQTGLTEGKHCSVCNVILVPQTEVAMTEHSYVDKYDADCDACGFERIPACAHLNTITISGKPATCTADGLSNGVKCVKCGEVIVEQIVIEALGHTDGVWYTDKYATCTVEGLRHQECAVCHEKIGEDKIKPLGHTEGSWIVDEEATCTGNGRRHNNCTVCGDIAKEETIAFSKIICYTKEKDVVKCLILH